MTTTRKRVQLMPVSQVMDFYYAEAIAAETHTAPNWRAGDKVVKDAAELRDSLADILAPALYNYLLVACWGEAQHFDREASGLGFSQSYNLRHALVFNQQSLVEALRCIFMAQTWGDRYGGHFYITAFGGESWGHICEELTKVGTLPKVAWVDHLIDLEHNGGNAFDKDEEARVVNMDIDHYLFDFLDFKAHEDILIDEPPEGELDGRYKTLEMSQEVKYLIARYYMVFKESAVPKWFGLNAKNRNIIPYTPPKWGNKQVRVSDLVLPDSDKVSWNKKGVLCSREEAYD